MKKTLITSITAFAFVLSAGMTMAGPLGDHGTHSGAHDLRPTVSQFASHADRMAHTHQSTKLTNRSFDVTSKQDLSQTNLSSTQQQSKHGSNLPYVVVNTGSNGSSFQFTIIPMGPPWYHPW